MTKQVSRRRGVVVRGRFRSRRPRAHHPRAFQDWRLPVDERRAQTLHRDLMPIAIIGEPRWPCARTGDPASAIGIALERLWISPLTDIRRDLILSALWACASAGDPASALMLAVIGERVDRKDCA